MTTCDSSYDNMKTWKVLKNPLLNVVEVVTDGQTDGQDEENMLPPEGVDIVYHCGTILLKEGRLLAV